MNGMQDLTIAKAAEQRQVAILTGRATASDVAAGLALGNAVAALFTARAGGMRTAAGSPALFAALAAAATARGEAPWRSLELPPRPPMLAAFGGVRAWMRTPADIVTERPPAPPSTSSAVMAREVDEVRQAVRKPTREQIAIVYEWADGLSSPTPPGHWNVIAAPYIAAAGFSDVRRPILRPPQRGVARRRRRLLGRQIQLLQPTPVAAGSAHPDDHRSAELPVLHVRHSTYSASAAEVLSYLFPTGSTEFHRLKEEAAISRLYGGIHYRSDIEIGKTHGARVGGYTVSFARTDGADLTR